MNPLFSVVVALAVLGQTIAWTAQAAEIQANGSESKSDELAQILGRSEVGGGLCVFAPSTDGRLEAALVKAGPYLVHGISTDREAVLSARRLTEQQACCGRAAIEHVVGFDRLPYADQLVNLLILDVDRLGGACPDDAEVLRVLAPKGKALIKQDGRWRTISKPRPFGFDEWTHLNHGPDGNPVSSDRHIADPYGLRWIGSKTMGWGSFSIRSSNDRVFVFWDTLLQWVDPKNNAIKIEARDAYSGVLLWEQYYPFPEKERTRPIAVGERIYMLSGKHVIGIDATDGRVLVTYKGCDTPYDAIVSDGVVVCRDERIVCGHNAETGRVLWRFKTGEHPDVIAAYGKRRDGHFQPGWRRQMLVSGRPGRQPAASYRSAENSPLPSVARSGETTASDRAVAGIETGRVFFTDQQSDDGKQWRPRIVGLDLGTGDVTWQTSGESIGRLPHPCFYADGVLMITNEKGYAGVPVDGKGKAWLIEAGGWKVGGNRVFRGFTGLNIPGYLYLDGLVWIKDRQKQRLGNLFRSQEEKPFKGWIGVDPHAGEIRRKIYYESQEYWSGRCFADVGCPGRIFADNMEIVHVASEQISNFRASRGQCGTGHIFANGLIYTSPHRCVSCYPMLRGVTALSGEQDRGVPVEDAERLEVFTNRQPTTAESCEQDESEGWPMYRHNPLRTNTTTMPLASDVSIRWRLDLKGRASAPTAAGGSVFLSIVNEGRVCAVDAENAEVRWSFVAGSRVDTPPTFHDERCIFGCHDGWIYCLHAGDGSPLWRYNAAPEHRRIVAYDRVESPWPVLGSVVIHDGMLYALAGRLTRSDGGMYLVALDPLTGSPKWRKHLPGIYGDDAHILPQSWHVNEEHCANNLLLAGGDALRLYDEFGTWQFDCKTGELTGRSHEVPQPGWPKGRLTPPNTVAAQRWPWAGWDRVTAAELLAGADTYNMMAHGMHPFTRSTPQYQSWQFPSRDRWGIHGTRLNKEKQFVIAPAKFTERHLDVEQMPWNPRTIDLDVKSYVFAGAGQTLVIAGGKPIGPHHTGGELRTIDMQTGQDLSVVTLPAPANFDGVAAAHGRVFVTTSDGQLICIGEE